MIRLIPVAILALTSALLFAFGVNLLYMTVRALRTSCIGFASPPEGLDDIATRVCVQLPIFNERYVAERVIDAVCAMEWPHDRLEVQVLDDSDDETIAIVARRVAHWRRRGVEINHIRRGSREGFKAGALAHGLARTDAPFIAIFDADFAPQPDFLRRIMGRFDDPKVAFAQARWGHLDETYSLFTRLQAMAIDYHFLVEQAVRSSAGYFTNFTGTAGVWRSAAIEDAGGWSARTLTEDLDLSYRAQLRGWKAAYVDDLVVPEELPVSIDAYRRQQSRWATGSFQVAIRLLRPVLQSDRSVAVKFQAVIHLLAYGVGPVMLLQLACYPLILATFGARGYHLPWYVADWSVIAILVGIAPWVGFIAAQTRRGKRWWRGVPALLCQVVGAGMSLNTLISLARATRPGGAFVRTPKYRIVRRGQEWRDQAYVRVGDPRALLEAGGGLLALAIVPFALVRGQLLIAVYASMFATGFLVVALLSVVDFLEVLTLRRLGARALSRVQAAWPAAALLGAVTFLLVLAAQLPEPFEDGYGHWLIAANLAATGHLHDPLFGMEDTWLPGYSVLAAGVLHVFGLWQLGALKAMSALFGVATAACVYALAPNRRQGLLAAALLVLNPVFLFTSGSAVVEPMLTALISGAALAAIRGRVKLAALLAAFAVTTSTKAWIWLAAVIAFAAIELVRTRAGARSRTAVAYAIPALGVLVVLQLGFAPASHSVARGTIEVMSATARGSVSANPLTRVLELGGTFGLAALPLFVFGALGAVLAIRAHATSAWRYLYAPAIAYLAAVFGLVGLGVYTGSHRYLYPALPALALLAAAALDRYSPAVRLTAIGATTLLAVAFLPVFASFGSIDGGLVAAGRAAGTSPGMLLTDSPVVAYYSGKAPAEITGSRSLPSDQSDAIAWLRAKDVTALALEDISYYRATTVFPDLARGQAIGPFISVGDQKNYQVTAGKPVYVYRLWPELSLEGVAQGKTPQGKTAPLAKGMTMGPAATGEGMGFGVPIVRYPDGWVYSRTVSDAPLSSNSWQRTYQLDEIGGDNAHDYRFVPIASRGAIRVTYALDANGVSIAVHVMWLEPGYSQVAVLNEQSAAFDDLAADHEATLIGKQFPSWTPVTGSWARVRSNGLGIEWSVPSVAGASLYAGRESAPPDFNWAGLDYLFDGPFTGAAYHVNVQRAR
ncbi:MAG TPA: glycosyltransferase [Candidatus Dormibacteraeota bacterium]|nr:glycosyltransferase [Candidatus Dormibacteraeota bacterium]